MTDKPDEWTPEFLATLGGWHEEIERPGRIRRPRNEFMAIIERADDWFIAYSPEIPGANGQGRTADEARANLGQAIALIFEALREDALRGLPESAIRDTVVVD
jgi:predicted RNase H-like HicB family nuclease